jgi:cyclase
MLVPRKFRILFFLWMASSAMVSSSAFAGQVHKVAPDLYAYISSNDSSANSTFLVSDAGILVIDTGLNEVEGKKLRDQIRKISAAPVRWIVNTHYHPDHRGGNSVFGADAIIISTLFTRERVLSAPPAAQSGSKSFALNIVVKNSMTLFVGGHPVEIYYPGPAHTLGDLVVYFPDQRTLAAGDLFLTNSCPAMDKGDMENWITALDHILALPVEHVIPGHFELATKVELGRFRDYLSALATQVREMRRKGMSLEQVRKGIFLPQFNRLRQFSKYEATFADNAEAYYKQLDARSR